MASSRSVCKKGVLGPLKCRRPSSRQKCEVILPPGVECPPCLASIPVHRSADDWTLLGSPVGSEASIDAFCRAGAVRIVARVAALSALARPQVVYALLRHCGPWALGVYYAHAAGTVGVPAFAVADAATWAIMAGRGALAIARRAGAWMTPSPGSDQPRWLQPGDWRCRYLQPICAEEGTICGNCLRIDDASDAAEDAARRHRPSIHRKAQAEGQECDERSRCEPHRWVRATGTSPGMRRRGRHQARPFRGRRRLKAHEKGVLVQKRREASLEVRRRAPLRGSARAELSADIRHNLFFFTRGNAFTQLPRGCWNEPRRCGSPSRRRSSVLWRRRP
jgi:hypothetical protein